MSVQAYIISYDISDNKERYKVEKLVRNYGQRVQKSVFYAVVDFDHLKSLKNQLQTLNIATGNVFILNVSRASWVSYGFTTFTPEEPWAFVCGQLPN